MIRCGMLSTIRISFIFVYICYIVNSFYRFETGCCSHISIVFCIAHIYRSLIRYWHIMNVPHNLSIEALNMNTGFFWQLTHLNSYFEFTMWKYFYVWSFRLVTEIRWIQIFYEIPLTNIRKLVYMHFFLIFLYILSVS